MIDELQSDGTNELSGTQNDKGQFKQEQEVVADGSGSQADGGRVVADKRKTRLFQLLILLFSIAAVAILAIIEFTGESSTIPFDRVAQTWLENWDLVLIAFLCLLAVVFLEAFSLFLLIGKTAKKWKPKLSAKTACLGRYWDNITPSAVGGQPYQMYYLRKYDMPKGTVSSVPVVFLFFRQLAFVLMACLALIFYGRLLTPLIFAATIIGTVFMALLPIGIVLFSFMPNLTMGMVVGILKLLHKIKLVKNLEKSKAKTIKYLKEYTDSIQVIGKNILFLLLIFALVVASQIAIMAVPYFVIEASGRSSAFLQTVAMAAIASSAVSFIPTPGNSGAAESAFYLVFGMIEGGFIFWAMLLWRFITYYLPTLIGAGISINDYVKRLIRSKRQLKRGANDGE